MFTYKGAVSMVIVDNLSTPALDGFFVISV